MEALAEGESLTLDDMTVTLHQRNAGERRADGWYAAHSEGCGFGVLMPGPYSDTSQEAPTADGQRLTIHTLATQTFEGTVFNALCWTRSDGSLPEGWSEGAVRIMARELGAEVLTIQNAGLDGHEIRGSDRRSGVVMRTLTGSGIGFQLIVEYPAAEAETALPLAEHFLDSFRPPTEAKASDPSSDG